MASDLIRLSAKQAADAIAAGEISAPELWDAYAGRIESEQLGAFLWRNEANDAGDGAGKPLGGVPLAVKDLFCIEGVPSRAASRILEGYVPPYTATSIAKLQAAGASVLGKTNMDEFAMGSSNENSAYGPVRNPWDETRVPGGSSGGSAAAAITILKELGARSVRLLCILGAPEGIAAVHERHPDVEIILAARDERLNEKGYIVPGLGDAGDRIYGTR